MNANAEHVPVVDIEPLMAASRSINAVIVRSLAAVDETLTVPELRVLVILAGRDGANLGAVAEELGVNPSNASRTCEKLVQRGLVRRVADAEDRRRVVLRVSPDGKRLLKKVMDRRRRLLAAVVDGMPAHEQVQLMAAMTAFNEAMERHQIGAQLSPSRLAPWVG